MRKYAQNDQNQDFGYVPGALEGSKRAKIGAFTIFFSGNMPKHYLKTYKSILGLEKISVGRTAQNKQYQDFGNVSGALKGENAPL